MDIRTPLCERIHRVFACSVKWYGTFAAFLLRRYHLFLTFFSFAWALAAREEYGVSLVATVQCVVHRSSSLLLLHFRYLLIFFVFFFALVLSVS